MIDPISRDDLVFIYESRSGRTELRKMVDGSIKKIPSRTGKGGIVALVRVTDTAYEREDSTPEVYTDKTSIWWRYFAPTESVNSTGFIPRTQAATLLGFADNYSFKGFGEFHTGLKQIPIETFERIRAAFLLSAKSDEESRLARAGQSGFGHGGEGPEHLSLKLAIAANPAGVLREPGLTLSKVEWLFPTADRIDVLLKDKFDRFVAVEVEVDCGQQEIVGPLQCIKYRSMLAYLFNRPVVEFRAILAAHTIHADVRVQCDCHGVQCVEVPRQL